MTVFFWSERSTARKSSLALKFFWSLILRKQIVEMKPWIVSYQREQRFKLGWNQALFFFSSWHKAFVALNTKSNNSEVHVGDKKGDFPYDIGWRKHFQCLEDQYRNSYLRQQFCTTCLALFTVWSEIIEDFEWNTCIVLFKTYIFVMKGTSEFNHELARLLCVRLGVLLVKKRQTCKHPEVGENMMQLLWHYSSFEGVEGKQRVVCCTPGDEIHSSPVKEDVFFQVRREAKCQQHVWGGGE